MSDRDEDEVDLNLPEDQQRVYEQLIKGLERQAAQPIPPLEPKEEDGSDDQGLSDHLFGQE